MTRRDFLKSVTLGTAALTVGPRASLTAAGSPPGVDQSANPPRLPRRPYGQTGQQLSIIGFGGIVVMGAEQEQANRVVADAAERGVNYFDVAPNYGDAELKLGPALQPYRKESFLACKTAERRAGPAKAQLDRSLERLKTDYLDLYQLHGITDVTKDVDAAFAAGGAMEVLTEARRSGRVRFLGFSAHSAEAAMTAMERFDFDSILWPINFASYFAGNFGPQVVAAAQEKGVARLALKAMARQNWPENDPKRQAYGKCWYQPVTDRRDADLALRFTLSQPVTAALPPGEEVLFRLALDLAMNFKPLTADEQDHLTTQAADLDPIFKTA